MSRHVAMLAGTTGVTAIEVLCTWHQLRVERERKRKRDSQSVRHGTELERERKRLKASATNQRQND